MPDQSIETVQSAIDYIETHLDRKLDLDQVAGAVHYSKYYLHRTFTKTVGLTIHDYTQRRKLTEAARLLVFSKKPILDIALLAGFESQQAFTDLFTAMYKLPPNQFREREQFYPLQLKFQFGGGYPMLFSGKMPDWKITAASEQDILCWMELVRLAIDGFPHLYEEEYLEVLRFRIKMRQAFLLKHGPIAAGCMLFSPETGSIDFMATHPLYRNKGIPRAFLKKAMEESAAEGISITTYREGDRADPGHRRQIMELGFAEAELLVEFGYPTQRFVMQGEARDEK